MSKEDVV